MWQPSQSSVREPAKNQQRTSKEPYVFDVDMPKDLLGVYGDDSSLTDAETLVYFLTRDGQGEDGIWVSWVGKRR
jgi:hypothetical protein